MNDILQERLNQLDYLEKFSCWYLVKQPTTFFKLCYLVSFLDEYLKNHCTEQFHQYISKKIAELNERKNLDISDNYRALLVAAYFGLIQKTAAKGSTYENSKITDTYFEIKERCNGEFEKTELYADIIERQIEKIYLSTAIDDQYEGIRANYKLYPVMFLYKILVEIGRTSGEYSITLNEYEYLVETTENYEDYLQTLFYIKLYRSDPSIDSKFVSKLGTKFDNRFKQAIKQLPTLVFEDNKIYLNKKYLNDIAKKLFYFDKTTKKANLGTYFDFLGSRKPLIEFNEEENNMSETKPFENFEYKVFYNNEDKCYNRIIFGAPGTGKSHKIDEEKDKLKDIDIFERVTFHPNYTYSQFVGTYKPVSEGKDIAYKYVEGPFMRLLTAALENAKDKNKDNRKRYLLIVEEINRANVAAAFGDMFQLLDRDKDGVSEYEIQSSEDVRKYLADKLGGDGSENKYKTLKLPNNFYIWATMNSADQGVFPMDTAFKRRWEFEYIDIDENADKLVYKDKMPILIPIPSKDGKLDAEKIKYNLYEWNAVREKINEKLSAISSVNEDKLLGPFFFILDKLRTAKDEPQKFIELFKSKVLMYLFEDVVKISPTKLFVNCGDHPRYSTICSKFNEIGCDIFDIELASVNPTEKERKQESANE